MKRVLLPLLLTACSPSQPSGTITAEEDRQLNEAAAALEANAAPAPDETGDPQ